MSPIFIDPPESWVPSSLGSSLFHCQPYGLRFNGSSLKGHRQFKNHSFMTPNFTPTFFCDYSCTCLITMMLKVGRKLVNSASGSPSAPPLPQSVLCPPSWRATSSRCSCMCKVVWTSAGTSLVLYSCSYTHNFLLVNNCFIEHLINKTSLRKMSSKYISSFQLGYHVCFRHQTFQHLHWEGEVQDGPSVLHRDIKWYIWEK